MFTNNQFSLSLSMAKITVVEKKLGREKAYGQAHQDDNLIEIDPRISAKNHLYVMVHELAHLMHPDWSEIKVIKESKTISNFLWKHGFRKVNLK